MNFLKAPVIFWQLMCYLVAFYVGSYVGFYLWRFYE